MTESYAKARAEFKAVTGIEVPALANLEADEFPYQEGAMNIIGLNVNYTCI